MKKINKFTVLLISLAMLLACKKDEKEGTNANNSLINTHKIFNVHVQRSYDQMPMSNYPICFLQSTWTSGSTYKDSVMFFNKTDTKGNAVFKINESLIQEKGNIFYYIATYVDYDNTTPDSTKAEWKLSGSSQVYHFGDVNYQTIMEVSPNCNAKIITNKIDWDEKNIDSMFIYSNLSYSPDIILKYYLIGQEQFSTQLSAICSENNIYTYYYYSNGIKSKEFTKELYVPFSTATQSAQPVLLDFK